MIPLVIGLIWLTASKGYAQPANLCAQPSRDDAQLSTTEQTPGSPAVVAWDAAFRSWDALPKTGVVQIALVLANDYQSNLDHSVVPALSNPRHDAELMSELLTDRGYKVICLLNLSKTQMIYSVQQFRVAWESLTVQPKGLIYFAGHGGETKDGDPFVVPADFDQGPQDQTGLDTLPLYDLLAWVPETSVTDEAPIIIIDACRTTVTTSQFNQVESRPAFKNSVQHIDDDEILPTMHLVFTTAHGSTADDGPAGRNGPFVDALRQFLQQAPWTEPQTPWSLPPDPLVTDEVDQISGALQSFSQYPYQPNREDDSLWIEQAASTQRYLLWLYGRIAREDPLHGNACLMLPGALNALTEDTTPSDLSSWVPQARDRFVELEKTNQCIPPIGRATDKVQAQNIRMPLNFLPSDAPQESPVSETRPDSFSDLTCAEVAKSDTRYAASMERLDKTHRLMVAQTATATPSLGQIQTQKLSIAIDGPSGAIQYDQLTALLSTLSAKGTSVQHVTLALVGSEPGTTSASPQTVPLNMFGALLKAQSLKNVFAKQLSLDDSAVDLKPELQRDWPDQSGCNSMNIFGLCLVVTVTSKEQ
jgi:hypothetical protein